MPISKGVLAFARFSLYGIAIVMIPFYLIRHFVYPSNPPATIAQPAPTSPMNPHFAARLDAAKKLFEDGQYADALAAYLEVDKAFPQLNDAEYQALKEARLQIAHAYESSGDSASASKTYVAIVSCALRGAKHLSEANDWDKALPRAMDAEQYSHHIEENQRLVIDRAMDAVVTAQRGACNNSDALLEQQHLVDYLESSGDRDDLLAKAYANLGAIYVDTQQWDNGEQALIRAGEICSLEENRRHSAEADYDKNFVDYQLVSLYLHSGKTDLGLAKAEEYYAKYHDSDTTSSYRYRSADFASLGVALARQAHQPDAINTWQGRMR